MTDERRRELERTLAAAPADGAARLELARLHAREGQAREALAALDLATIPDAWFAEAKGFSEELWRGRLAGLAVARELGVLRGQLLAPRIDHAGRLVAFHEGGGERTGVFSLDGTVSRVEHDHEWFQPHEPFRGGVIRQAGRSVLRLALASGGLEVSEAPLPPGMARLVAVAPEGDLLLLEDALRSRASILRWPDFEVVLEAPCPRGAAFVEPEADWGARRLIVRVAERESVIELAAVPFGGGHAVSFELPLEDHALDVLAPGVLADWRRVLEIHLYFTGRSFPLLEGEWKASHWPFPSLSSDGRTLRLGAGETPLAFTLDVAAGTLVASERNGRPVATRATRQGAEPLWHPHADAVVFRPKGKSAKLRDASGEVLLDFAKGTRPLAWTPDGESLLVERRGERETFVVEVWRVS